MISAGYVRDSSVGCFTVVAVSQAWGASLVVSYLTRFGVRCSRASVQRLTMSLLYHDSAQGKPWRYL